MGIINFFKKKELSHSEKVSIAYRCYKADTVNMIFPGGIRQADIIICSLAKIYGLHLDSLDEVGYHDVLATYSDVLIRKAIAQSDNGIILVSLQTKHNNLVKSPEIAKSVLAYTNLNMLDYFFALECEADVKLLSEDVVVDNDEVSEKRDNIEMGFYFENVLELEIYGKLFGKEKFVSWLSGDAYLNEYQKGFQLVEQGQFAEAIKVFKASLSLNPIGISARFEMCECFIQLKDFSSAKKVLDDMAEYLLDPKHIAKFYRRRGYIEIENSNYLGAVACYAYSKNFEHHPSVEQELQYICAKTGVCVNSELKNSAAILGKYNIPILKKRKIDDI